MKGFNRQPPRLARSLLALAVIALTTPLAAQAQGTPSFGAIEAGHSAMWFDPSRDGEGWQLEIRPDDQASLYWYTYDEHGKQRWLGGNGDILRDPANGDRIVFSELYSLQGPKFGADFDPEDAVRETIGEATIRFVDCNSGIIEFDAYGKTGTFPLERLTRTMGAGCAPIHGRPGDVVDARAGQSGSWFDPEYDGQGFSLSWLADGSAALVWFTFDTDGKPLWLTGTGEAHDGRIVFDTLYTSHGGRFGEAFDPAGVERTAWGRMELDLQCNSGAAMYMPQADGFSDGVLDLTRLTRLLSPACPWTAPKFTDLYEIELIELPVPVPTAEPPLPVSLGSGNLIFPGSVADNGTVIGIRKMHAGVFGEIRYQPVRLEPDADTWKDLSVNPVSDTGMLSSDGSAVLINRMLGIGPGYVLQRPSLVDANGESPLADLQYPNSSTAYDASNDLSHVVGSAIVPAGENGLTTQPWRWNEVDGQVPLEETPGVPGTRATLVSDDGTLILGSEGLRLAAPIPGVKPPRGILWRNGNAPEPLPTNDNQILGAPLACADNCRIVIGHEHWEYTDPEDPATPVLDDAWIWKAPGEVTYIGPLGEGEMDGSDPIPGWPVKGWPYQLKRASTDGLIGGVYRSPDMLRDDDQDAATGGLIWTQNTGFVLLPEVLEELDMALDWPSMHVAGISANGKYVLITTGEVEGGPSTDRPTTSRSALLRLTARNP